MAFGQRLVSLESQVIAEYLLPYEKHLRPMVDVDIGAGLLQGHIRYGLRQWL
jgi:hypothetical protein